MISSVFEAVQAGEGYELQSVRGQAHHPADRRRWGLGLKCQEKGEASSGSGDLKPKLCVCVCTGPASLLCAETLRQNRYEGRIVMVTRDTLPPIDKPKLSKVRVKGHESVESWHNHRCSRTLPKRASFEPTGVWSYFSIHKVCNAPSLPLLLLLLRQCIWRVLASSFGQLTSSSSMT